MILYVSTTLNPRLHPDWTQQVVVDPDSQTNMITILTKTEHFPPKFEVYLDQEIEI